MGLFLVKLRKSVSCPCNTELITFQDIPSLARQGLNFHTVDTVKTVGFFREISKELGKAWRKSLTRAKRLNLTCEARGKKKVLLASLPSLALCFQPRSRPFF